MQTHFFAVFPFFTFLSQQTVVTFAPEFTQVAMWWSNNMVLTSQVYKMLLFPKQQQQQH